MLKRTKRHILTFALGVGITATTVALYTPSNADSTTKLAPVQAKQLVDKDAIIDALTETPELVGLTGDISKTVRLTDDKWFGDKTYELTLEGTFKLGVATDDVSITTQGNTVIVRLPQPRIIAVDLPFDKAAISKDVGLLRQDLSESELQALYKVAREQAVADVKVNAKAREEAEEAVENALEELIGRLPAVESVEFEN
ncbi:DUF4230 domain-containing protein [Rossellomorea sp. FS2]|uniref:DUF4230 domain-containing protein n=1 Tax=Rossellomorea sp. FS2 TaxID=3391447 RepID=UPI003A4E5B42